MDVLSRHCLALPLSSLRKIGCSCFLERTALLRVPGMGINKVGL